MKQHGLGYLFGLGLALWLLTSAVLAAPNNQPRGPVPGRFVVKLRPRVPASLFSQALAGSISFQKISGLKFDQDRQGSLQWDRLYVLQTEDESVTSADIAARLGSANIEYVEPDYYLEFFDYPTDPLFAHQWYLNNTGQSYWAVERLSGANNDTLMLRHGTAGNDIDLAYYYDNPPAQNRKVVVAVVDTGIDPLHPDLQGALWFNRDEIPGNGLDDDHNGFIDDTIGYDVSGDSLSLYKVVGDNDPTDIIGHGTHIAGIIAAAHNGQGITGITTMAEVMGVKIRPNGTTSVGAAGIAYAVNAGADVINLSWGTPFESLILKEAVDFACANGVLVCAAAGNTGDLRLMYPAALEGSFTVAAGDSHGNVTRFSTYGPHIDLVAPGQDILSLRAGGTDMYADAEEPGVHIVGADSLYYLASGTSMAAPMVAGAAALIWSVRPHLTLEQLESDLRYGARDILDPYAVGDSLPGPDSISGFGYLDIHNSLELARNGGLFFVQPRPRERYVGEIEIKANAVAGYTGGWSLACAPAADPNSWLHLAEGASVPSDSLLYTLTGSDLNGRLTFRLTDDYQVERFVGVTLVTGSRLEITSPLPGQEYDYNIPIAGSVYGPGYESLALYYAEYGGGARLLLHETSGEYFDSLIFNWNASGVALGGYTLYLETSFDTGLAVDSVNFSISSAFADGWPQNLSGRGALSAVAADLNNDGPKELIVGTTYGLNAYTANGCPLDGFPVLAGTSVRSIPAAYDIDRDGQLEIICTGDSGIHVFNYDGSYAPGWPVSYPLGHLGYGSPVPVVTELGADEDSAIVLIDGLGNVLAYEFDGQPYFYSLAGWFASFNHEPVAALYFNGNTVSGTDLDGDGRNELVASYSAEELYTGVGIFEGRTGQPAFDRPLPYVVQAAGLFGTVLTDLNGDELPEVIVSGYDSAGTIMLWAKTLGTSDLPGWPIALPAIDNWIGIQPTVIDLDLDGSPEIVATYYEFDIGVVYVFRADGSPYRTVEGYPPGEAYRYAGTLGAPVAANLLGDCHPELVIRSGHIMPGSGREEVHILDHSLVPVPGWPVATPTPPAQVFFTPYTPLVDDVDDDGLVELVLVGEGLSVFVWDFEASSEDGKNLGRLFADNLNSSVLPPERVVTDVRDPAATVLPRQFRLHQNYPNPFNPTTLITFEIPSRQSVRLEVFNILGQRVSTLVDQELPGGGHTIQFDGSRFASGVYLCRLRAGTEEGTCKMVLLK